MYNGYNYYGMQLQPKYEVVKVSGRDGANAFQMGANSSVLLLDEKEPIVYLKTTDGGGFPTITAYSITPYQDVQKQRETQILQSFDERLKRLEELYEQSNNKQHELTKNNSTNRTSKANDESTKNYYKSSTNATNVNTK